MSERRQLLLVDDDSAMRQMLAALFEEQGYTVHQADSARSAIAQAQEIDFDVVLSDIRMPGKTGIEMVGEMRSLRPRTPVILMTAFGSIDSAIGAMRAGAFDYITKPFEPDTALITVERALEQRALEQENQRLRRAVDQTTSFGDLIGASPAMRDIFALIRKVAHGRSTVLITGDSGTGKEVVARTLHYHGARADQPFIPVNCSAIPEGLLESELFGHVKGAFTGAIASKRGLFEEASGGTLFLDEIGDMGPGLQSKLLRVLQDGEIRPVGGNQSMAVDVRIVAATHQDLMERIETGEFREDLYYRLNVIPIHIPPLSERPEDIPALVDAFVKKHSDGSRRSFSTAAVRELKSWNWKGNARELENVVERTLALSDSIEIGIEDLPSVRASEGENGHASDAFLGSAAERQLKLRDVEEMYIEEVLRRTNGNKVQASKILGVDRKTLYRRIERRAQAAGTNGESIAKESSELARATAH
ncbi:MAG: sigma-54-dependent Fis family transcriptional regulator [Deltaproteobacteria bacterium]|nr:sigma-54-dependent Fis family transcriptional regulator [Deltaproteobacteria bacterium]